MGDSRNGHYGVLATRFVAEGEEIEHDNAIVLYHKMTETTALVNC